MHMNREKKNTEQDLIVSAELRLAPEGMEDPDLLAEFHRGPSGHLALDARNSVYLKHISLHLRYMDIQKLIFVIDALCYYVTFLHLMTTGVF